MMDPEHGRRQSTVGTVLEDWIINIPSLWDRMALICTLAEGAEHPLVIKSRTRCVLFLRADPSWHHVEPAGASVKWAHSA